MHPELQIWTGGRLEDLRSLEAWLQSNREAWELEIEYLGLGSLRLKLKPSGESIKKVAKAGAATVTMVAGLSTLTGYTAKSIIADTPSKPPASHSVVQANGKTIPLPQPREHQIIFHLSHGSTISESIRLPDGKRIEWKSKVGPEGATVSEDLGQ